MLHFYKHHLATHSWNSLFLLLDLCSQNRWPEVELFLNNKNGVSFYLTAVYTCLSIHFSSGGSEWVWGRGCFLFLLFGLSARQVFCSRRDPRSVRSWQHWFPWRLQSCPLLVSKTESGFLPRLILMPLRLSQPQAVATSHQGPFSLPPSVSVSMWGPPRWLAFCGCGLWWFWCWLQLMALH